MSRPFVGRLSEMVRVAWVLHPCKPRAAFRAVRRFLSIDQRSSLLARFLHPASLVPFVLPFVSSCSPTSGLGLSTSLSRTPILGLRTNSDRRYFRPSLAGCAKWPIAVYWKYGARKGRTPRGDIAMRTQDKQPTQKKAAEIGDES